jgi:hypothetical protein
MNADPYSQHHVIIDVGPVVLSFFGYIKIQLSLPTTPQKAKKFLKMFFLSSEMASPTVMSKELRKVPLAIGLSQFVFF